MPVLDLKCDCGTVKGAVVIDSPSDCTRVICHCDDCQAFANKLGHTTTLDGHGGTDITQISQARLMFESFEHIGILQHSNRGLFRWYTTCCKTPLGNSMRSPRMPFFGLIHTSVDHGEHDRDGVFGPPIGHVHTKWATGDRSTRPPETGPLRTVPTMLGRLFGWWWAGDARRSGLFEHGAPRVTPDEPGSTP